MKLFKYLSLVLLPMVLYSCAYKKTVYFQDTHNGYTAHVDSIQEVRLQPGDRLSIYIKSKTPELATQVSLYMGYSATNLSTGTGLSNYGNNNYSYGQNYGSSNGQYGLSYTVLTDGTIEMPAVGFLHVAGMTRVEVQNLVEQTLKEKNLVQDAVVIVEFLSQTYTIISATGGGQQRFTKDYMTIVDAVAAAGVDLQDRRNDIRVFRLESDSSVQCYTVNFLSADSVFASPVYYVKPNDVIYIVPTKNKVRASTPNGTMFQTYGFWIGSVSTVVSMITLVTTLTTLFKK